VFSCLSEFRGRTRKYLNKDTQRSRIIFSPDYLKEQDKKNTDDVDVEHSVRRRQEKEKEKTNVPNHRVVNQQDFQSSSSSSSSGDEEDDGAM
jgi:hypothetical protein